MLDQLDRKIIVQTQGGLEIISNPYTKIAQQLGIDESELFQRLATMKQKGILRRIALVPNHYKLGFKANGMSVWKIQPDQVYEVGKLFGNLSFVSHCYERGTHPGFWEYNIFAMVHDKKEQGVQRQIQYMYELVKDICEDYDVLYSEKILKKTGLRIKKGN